MSEYRPLVGVVGGDAAPSASVEALRRAGARIAIVPPDGSGDPRDLLEPFDGLLLIGEGDVEPDRDGLELALLRAADDLGMPSLCICRGAQLMNLAFGGTLHQHLPGALEHGARTTHDVDVEPGTRLSATTKQRTLACSSHHHHAGIDRVGDGLRAIGHGRDGLVEAIERIVDDPDDEDQTWMVGVQWHPEDTAAGDPAQQALFDALSLIARLQGSRARPGQTTGRSRAYAVVEHDPSWAARFAEEAARIQAVLPPDLVARIDHVGSTSVPGLAAKPIVDIQLSLRALSPREPYVVPLVALGYRHVVDPWRDDHEYFSRNVGGQRAFQIHVCLAGSEWERRHLAFRDWLRTHPEDAAAYADLKRRNAERHPRDIMAYVDAKTPFIRGIEAKALAEIPGRPTLDDEPRIGA